MSHTYTLACPKCKQPLDLEFDDVPDKRMRAMCDHCGSDSSVAAYMKEFQRQKRQQSSGNEGGRRRYAVIAILILLLPAGGFWALRSLSGNTSSQTVAGISESVPAKATDDDPYAFIPPPTPPALGWSIDKVKEMWGPDDGWEWYNEEYRIDGNGKSFHARLLSVGNKFEIQALGHDEDLEGIGAIMAHPGHEPNAENVGMWATAVSMIPAQVSGVAMERLASWFAQAHARFLRDIVDSRENSRMEMRREGNLWFKTMIMLTTEGYTGAMWVYHGDGEHETLHPLEVLSGEEINALASNQCVFVVDQSYKKRIDDGDDWSDISWKVDVKNRCQQTKSFSASIQFIDREGYLLDDAYESGSISAGQTRLIRGNISLSFQQFLAVDKMVVELETM